MQYKSMRFLLLGLIAASIVGCSDKEDDKGKDDGKTKLNDTQEVCTAIRSTAILPGPIRSDYEAKEITKICDQAIAIADFKLKTMVDLPENLRNFDNTMLAFENTLTDLYEELSPLTLMGDVSTEAFRRDESFACRTKSSQYLAQVMTRRDIYNVLKTAVARDAQEQRLTSETLKAFVKNGLNLGDEDLAQVRSLNEKLSELESKYNENLNGDDSFLEFTADELKGTHLDMFKTNASGKYVVKAEEPHVVEVLKYADLDETRRLTLVLWNNRQAANNTALLEEALVVRQKLAKLLGFQSWAHVQLEGRMAKDVSTVMNFLNELKGKLAARNKAELDRALTLKKELDPAATELHPWDVSYYNEKIRIRDFNVDANKVKEYFPAGQVISRMFSIYSHLFGVNFVEIPDAAPWHSTVRLYEIVDARDCTLIGHFYADLEPRDGKYSHAAANTLTPYRIKNGNLTTPVAAIVANLNPATDGKPALLSHEDVETLFHEFGHIVHMTLTKVPFASLGGANTADDFVEAPSQMLENWVWNPQILARISGHYSDRSKKLPADMLEQMIAAKNMDQGYSLTRQLAFTLFDMEIHTAQGPVDVTATFNRIYKDVIGLEPTAGTHIPASFGHMMGGYDAGYYGYLWSLVYADDMFTRFQTAPKGLLDEAVGNDYRREILEKGSIQDPMELLKAFMGREPNANAFLQKLGIQ